MDFKTFLTNLQKNPWFVAFYTALGTTIWAQVQSYLTTGVFNESGQYWLKTVVAAAAVATAAVYHLSITPAAPTSNSVAPSTVTKISALLLASLLIVPVVGCKVVSTNPPTAPGVSALNVLYMVQADVLALQKAEIAAVNAGLIDSATNLKIQAALKQEAIDATALGVAISSAATATTVQAKVNALLADLQNDVSSGALGIKDANTQATITASIAATELAVNGIMTAYNAGK